MNIAGNTSKKDAGPVEVTAGVLQVPLEVLREFIPVKATVLLQGTGLGTASIFARLLGGADSVEGLLANEGALAHWPLRNTPDDVVAGREGSLQGTATVNPQRALRVPSGALETGAGGWLETGWKTRRNLVRNPIAGVGVAAWLMQGSSLLDAFAEIEDPLATNWDGPASTGDGDMESTGTAAVGKTSGYNSAYRTDLDLGDIGVMVDVPVLPASGDEEVGVLARVQDPGTDLNCYQVGYDVDDEAYKISRCLAGTWSTREEFEGTFEAGDGIGISCVGTQISAWRRPEGGEPELIGAITDEEITGTGTAGITTHDTVAEVANFRAWAMAATGPYPAFGGDASMASRSVSLDDPPVGVGTAFHLELAGDEHAASTWFDVVDEEDYIASAYVALLGTSATDLWLRVRDQAGDVVEELSLAEGEDEYDRYQLAFTADSYGTWTLAIEQEGTGASLLEFTAVLVEQGDVLEAHFPTIAQLAGGVASWEGEAHASPSHLGPFAKGPRTLLAIASREDDSADHVVLGQGIERIASPPGAVGVQTNYWPTPIFNDGIHSLVTDHTATTTTEDPLIPGLSHSLRITSDGAGTTLLRASALTLPDAGPWWFTAWVRVAAGWDGGDIQMGGAGNGYTGVSWIGGVGDWEPGLGVEGQWVHLDQQIELDADLTGNPTIQLASAATAGKVVDIAVVMCTRRRVYELSDVFPTLAQLADGSAEWTGTAYESSSEWTP